MWARFYSTAEAVPSAGVRSRRGIRIRQAHRWIAIVFILTIVANLCAMAFGQPPAWIVYSPLPPLLLLVLSGLNMLVSPWFRRQ